MAFLELVARTATTICSLAGHQPPFFTNNMARPWRCRIVDWNHQRLPGSLLAGSTASSRREGA
jgi:hypothetical protein